MFTEEATLTKDMLSSGTVTMEPTKAGTLIREVLFTQNKHFQMAGNSNSDQE
jgi:hypothetical protein